MHLLFGTYCWVYHMIGKISALFVLMFLETSGLAILPDPQPAARKPQNKRGCFKFSKVELSKSYVPNMVLFFLWDQTSSGISGVGDWFTNFGYIFSHALHLQLNLGEMPKQISCSMIHVWSCLICRNPSKMSPRECLLLSSPTQVLLLLFINHVCTLQGDSFSSRFWQFRWWRLMS